MSGRPKRTSAASVLATEVFNQHRGEEEPAEEPKPKHKSNFTNLGGAAASMEATRLKNIFTAMEKQKQQRLQRDKS